MENSENDKELFKELYNKYLELNNIHLSNNEVDINEKIDKCITYMNFLVEWNTKINLTAITTPDMMISKHFIDSISVMHLAEIFQTDKKLKLLDIGTGAGFPSIPIKIMSDKEIDMDLVDSTKKKLNVVTEGIELLNLSTNGDVKCHHARAEDLAFNDEFRESYDVVVSRAVAKLSVLVELAIPFLKLDGYFIALKQEECSEEIKNAKNAILTIAGQKSLDTLEVKQVKIPIKGSENITHTLIIIRKMSETLFNYPRSNSQIKKNPL